jgi:hypothetical protein
MRENPGWDLTRNLKRNNARRPGDKVAVAPAALES